MYITYREREILNILLKEQPLFITISSIANKLNVSERTIQREIKNIEATIVSFNLSIEKKPNVGIRILGNKKGFDDIKNNISVPQFTELTLEERAIILLYNFMNSTSLLKANILSKEMRISNSTLMDLLTYFESKIKDSPLKFIRRKGYGLELIGAEKDKRIALINMMISTLENKSVYSVKDEQFLFFDFIDRVLGIFDLDKIRYVEKIVLENITDLPYIITDYSTLEIVLYTSLAIERVQNGFILTDSNENVLNSDEYQIAKMIFDTINKKYNLDIPDSETEFLAINFKSAKRIKKFDLDSNIDLNLIAIDLVKMVSEKTGYYFNNQKNFMSGLISHLEPLLNRVKLGIFVDNPIKEEIKHEFSVLFQTIDHILKEKFPDISFSEDEIAFLTIHFASAITIFTEVPQISTLVVCSSGIGTSRMLSKKLIMNFPQLTIIEHASIRELSTLDVSKFDLIISTVGIHNADFEYIHVNTMLSESDITNIENKIQLKIMDLRNSFQQRITNSEDDTSKTIDKISLVDLNNKIMFDILNNFNVLDTSSKNLNELMNEIVITLDKISQSTKEIIIRDIINKEKIIGSGIPDSKIAFLHARFDEIDQSIFKIYRNNNQLRWKGMDSKEQAVDTICFLIAPNKLNEFQLEILSAISITLLEPLSRDIYCFANRENVYTFLEGKLELVYKTLLEKIWRN